MLDEKPPVFYQPKKERPKKFASFLIGVLLVIIGAVLINKGVGAVQGIRLSAAIGIGLLISGSVLAFAGASSVWPGNVAANATLFVAGVVFLVMSGGQLAPNWDNVAYILVPTLVGVALIVVGVQLITHSWKRYSTR